MRLTWLIRHAESTGNAGEITDLPATIPLSAAGRIQAAELVKRFADLPSLVVVSPYGRTLETAGPLIERHPQLPVQTWPVHEFTFLAPARYVGTTQDERSVPAGFYWQECDPDHNGGDGAETFREFIGRVDEALERLNRLSERFTAVFTHGYFIKAALWRLSQPGRLIDTEGMLAFREFHRSHAVDNACVFPLLHNGGPVQIGIPLETLTPAKSEE